MKRLFVLFLLLVALVSSAQVEIGQPAPAWTLTDIHGRTLRSSNFLGKVVVVNVFATWCVPCVWEVPDLVALQNKYWRQGLVIVGVGARQFASELLPFAKTYTVNYHICPSTDAALWDFGMLPAGALPTTVVINRQGVVAASWKYYHTKSFFEEQLVPLLFPSHLPVSP